MEPIVNIESVIEAGLWAGRQQAFAVIGGKCDAAKAACLKQIHDTKAYENLGVTWEEFCPKYAGISRARADELLRRFNDLGAEYFRLAEIASISTSAYRAIAPHIDGETIELQGEHVPLTQDNAPKIRAGIRRLLADLKQAHDRETTLLGDFYHRIDAVARDVYRFHQHRKLQAHQTGLSSVARHAQDKFRRLAEDIEKDEPKNLA